MAITTGTLGNYIETLATLTKEGMDNLQNDTMLGRLFDVKSTNKKTVRVQDIENTGSASRVTEGSGLPELDFHEGYPQAYTVQIYGAKMGITDLMRRTSQKDIMADMNQQLQLSVRNLTNILVHHYFDYGSVTGSSVPQIGGAPAVNTVGNDSLSLFNAAHTYATNGGYTYRNVAASADTPSETSIDTNYRVIRRWRDNAGNPKNINIINLFGPPELETAFIKALESRLEADTANNAVNTAPKLVRSSYFTSQWLSDTSDWYMETDATGGNLEWHWLQKPTVEKLEKIDDTGNIYICVRMIAAHGAARLRKWYKVG